MEGYYKGDDSQGSYPEQANAIALNAGKSQVRTCGLAEEKLVADLTNNAEIADRVLYRTSMICDKHQRTHGVSRAPDHYH